MQQTNETENRCYKENEKYLRLAQAGDEDAVARLMESNSGLVGGIARRFMGRGVEFEDLVQIGSIGMLKAIRSFDLDRGTMFSTYAVPLIIGEIRKFMRDDGLIKVSRIQKKASAILMHEREKFLMITGREPHIEELASLCDMTPEDAVDALNSTSAVHSFSEILSDTDNFTLENIVHSNENKIDSKTEQIALYQAIDTLPPMWKKIIIMRYYRDMSQQQTAELLGVSQVKISREEKKIFEALRRQLG